MNSVRHLFRAFRRFHSTGHVPEGPDDSLAKMYFVGGAAATGTGLGFLRGVNDKKVVSSTAKGCLGGTLLGLFIAYPASFIAYSMCAAAGAGPILPMLMAIEMERSDRGRRSRP